MALSPLTITNFQVAGGPNSVNYVSEGEVTIRLNKDCMGPDGQVSTRAVVFDLDEVGAPIGPPLFWPNIEMAPNDSVYIISVKNAQGQRIMGPSGIYVGAGSPPSFGFGSGFGSAFGS